MTTPTLEIDASTSLAISIGNLVTEMKAERRRKENLAADVAYVEAPAIPFTAAPFVAGAGWGPNTGYIWAIQRMTVAGLGATTDFVNVYRGNVAAAGLGNNALFTFQEAVAGGVATWHPGRTGLILKADESLVFTGTFTGTQGFVSADVIQLTEAQIPYFLL